MTKLKFRFFTALAIVGLATSFAVVPATASFAAQKGYAVNCSLQSSAHLNSKGAQNVAHYHNGVLVAQWYQGVSTWHRTYHPPVSAIFTAWSSWAIYDSNAYCYQNA